MEGDHFGIDFWYTDDVYIYTTGLTLIGDANCDGNINILDVISTASEIMSQEPEPFCFENADVNSDGIINLLDLIGIANIIIGGKWKAFKLRG